MSVTKAASRGVPVTLQSIAVTGSGIVIAIPSGIKNHQLILKGSAGVSVGAVQPETADSFDYAGTWAPIGGGPVTLIASTEILVAFTGEIQFLRARISTDVVGGTATVIYLGS